MKYFLLAISLIAVIGMIYVFSHNKSVEQTPEISKPMEDKLIIEDLKIGDGAAAQTSDIVFVNYLGTFLDGTKFDSSYDRGEPFSFTLGQGQVIQGWDKGVLGMKVGGKRKLTIPPSLAYGEYGMGAIPSNSTLVFEVELLDIK